MAASRIDSLLPFKRCKVTNKRAKCQIYLSISKRKYFGRRSKLLKVESNAKEKLVFLSLPRRKTYLKLQKVESNAKEKLVFLIINMFYFPLSEGPGLRKRFGKEYEEYCKNVPRYISRLTP